MNADAMYPSVIFVHGLHGNAHQTWTDQNNTFFWPQQLGVDIPSARIITFGYSSSKFTDDAIPRAVGESAKALVDLLWGARKDHRNRPMIFVTEGLGGHIVQDTLLICQKSPYLKDLLSSVFAIIFFSTSYSGDGLMVSDYITAGSLGKPRKINKPTSNSLQAATTVASHTTVLDFEQLLLRSKIDVKTIDDKSEKMVESTALFQKSGPNISAKRQAMTAFTSRTDVRYKRVVETIRMWMYQV